MASLLKRTWQRAVDVYSRGKLNRAFQEKVDIYRLYLLTVHRDAPAAPGEAYPGASVSYLRQRAAVAASLGGQVEELFTAMSRDGNAPMPGGEGNTFRLAAEPSPIPGAGIGVLLKGSVAAGRVAAFYPGTVYLPMQIRSLPNYPHVDKDNDYLLSRFDGTVIDAIDYVRPPKGAPSVRRSFNTLALAHLLNHPPAGTQPNVMWFPFDFPASLSPTLTPFVPNAYVKAPSFLYGRDVLVRGMVAVTTQHIADAELLINYRYNPALPAPPWYTPVDIEEDRRRWS